MVSNGEIGAVPNGTDITINGKDTEIKDVDPVVTEMKNGEDTEMNDIDPAVNGIKNYINRVNGEYETKIQRRPDNEENKIETDIGESNKKSEIEKTSEEIGIENSSNGGRNEVRKRKVDEIEGSTKVISLPKQKIIEDSNSGEEHKINKPFACPHCPRRFKIKSLLVNHVHVHTEEKLFCCPECYKLFESDKKLSIHLIFHRTTEQVGPFICPHCSREFEHKYSWQRHVFDHEKEDSEIVQACHACKMCFKSNSQFRRHRFKYHREEIMKEKNEYKQLEAMKAYVCPHCNKEIGKRRWKKHMIIHKEGRERNYLCSHCQKAFLNKHHLAKHELLHTDRDKEFVCNHCKRSFLHKRTLDTHAVRCVEKSKTSCSSESIRHKCPTCERGYMSKAILKQHMKVHTERKINYLCSVCSKSFIHKVSRDRHEIFYHKKNSTEKEKSFSCSSGTGLESLIVEPFLDEQFITGHFIAGHFFLDGHFLDADS